MLELYPRTKIKRCDYYGFTVRSSGKITAVFGNVLKDVYEVTHQV